MSANALQEMVEAPKPQQAEPPAAIPLRRPEDRGNTRKGPPEPSNDGPQAAKQAEAPFTAIGEDLERRSRSWGNMVRMLEQHRRQLEGAEADRDATHSDFSRIVPAVLEAARELKDAMDATKAGQGRDNIPALFDKNAEALDRLESVASTLSVRLMWCRMAWEQYAASIKDAQRLRTEADAVGA